MCDSKYFYIDDMISVLSCVGVCVHSLVSVLRMYRCVYVNVSGQRCV